MTVTTRTTPTTDDVQPVTPAILRRVECGRRANWWRRRRVGAKRFAIEDAAGRRITDGAALARVQALRIPPAWRDVRVAPSPRSAIQAVGVDRCGRVQYLYHPAFAARRAKAKYDKLERFGRSLPKLRAAADAHLALPGFPRERVLALVVRLISSLYFRVGSEKSVARYRTFGVTTLRNRHLAIRDACLAFNFVGKHHVRCRSVLVDEGLAAIMRELKALGGPKVFEYVGADGKIHAVASRDVNDYIKSLAGPEFSAKDFRTWGGTLLAAIELAELGAPTSEADAKRKIARAVRRVAERLGNTPAVCRACYIHPVVFERFREGLTLAQFRPRRARVVAHRLTGYEPEEVALLELFNAGNGRAGRLHGAPPRSAAA